MIASPRALCGGCYREHCDIERIEVDAGITVGALLQRGQVRLGAARMFVQRVAVGEIALLR